MKVIAFIGTMLFILGMAAADSASIIPTVIMMSLGLGMLYIGAINETD